MVNSDIDLAIKNATEEVEELKERLAEAIENLEAWKAIKNGKSNFPGS